MNNTKKDKKTGRPERYPGEKQERLSVMLRPRYKKALEMVAKHRGTTLTEAAELAIAVLSRVYTVDRNGDETLEDYIANRDEFFSQYYESSDIPNGFCFVKEDALLRQKQCVEKMRELADLPPSLNSAFDNFFSSVLVNCSNNYGVIFQICFDITKFKKALLEHWKTNFEHSNDYYIEIHKAMLIIVAEYLYFFDTIKNKDILEPDFSHLVITTSENYWIKTALFHESEEYKKLKKYIKIVSNDSEDTTLPLWFV